MTAGLSSICLASRPSLSATSCMDHILTRNLLSNVAASGHEFCYLYVCNFCGSTGDPHHMKTATRLPIQRSWLRRIPEENASETVNWSALKKSCHNWYTAQHANTAARITKWQHNHAWTTTALLRIIPRAFTCAFPVWLPYRMAIRGLS